MKLIVATAISLFLGTLSLSAQQQTQWLEPSEISYRNELPRTPLLSYNNREQSLQEDYLNSTYIQWLDGQWKVKTFDAPAEIDSALFTADISGWQQTTVPQTQDNEAWAAVYRTEFKMPFAWIDREIFLNIGAVSRAYYAYVNGELVGYHEDSKTPAYFDITKYVQEGKNQLAVVAYAHPVSTTLENQIDIKGTAIEQNVYIMAQPKVRIRDYVIDTQFDPDGTSGLFNLGVIVKSHLLNTKEVTVYYELLGPDSTKIINARRDARFNLRGEDTVRFFANIPNIETWSHESPKLYTVAVKIQHEGRFKEYAKFRIGFRNVVLDDQGLLINGHPVEINAIDYDCPGDEAALIRDFENFRKMGINLLRVDRYPQSNRFYDLCDIYGFYVCDQANIDSHLSGSSLKIGGTPANDPQWEAAHADRVMNMYQFSKNHPSVIMFSLGRDAGRGYNMYEAYLRLKEAEQARPVIYEGAGAEWNTDMVVGTPAGRNASDGRPAIRFTPQEKLTGKPVTPPGVTIEAGDEARAEAVISNGFHQVNLNNFDVGYVILAGKRIVKEGALDSNIAPQDKKAVAVPLDGVKPGKYTLIFYVAHADATPWAQKGERIAETSYQLVVPKPEKEKPGL